MIINISFFTKLRFFFTMIVLVQYTYVKNALNWFAVSLFINYFQFQLHFFIFSKNASFSCSHKTILSHFFNANRFAWLLWQSSWRSWISERKFRICRACRSLRQSWLCQRLSMGDPAFWDPCRAMDHHCHRRKNPFCHDDIPRKTCCRWYHIPRRRFCTFHLTRWESVNKLTRIFWYCTENQFSCLERIDNNILIDRWCILLLLFFLIFINS